MKIKALVPFSNGTLSMEQYEVREVTDALGNELTSAGVAVEIGGGGLPPVTETDAGKVLAVDNSGVWVAQTPTAGGGDTEYVHFTVTGDNVTCDHTAAEINDAIQEGKDVIGILSTGIAPSLSGVSKVGTGGNSYLLNFGFSIAYFGGSGDKLCVYKITVQSSGSISKTVKYASLTS